MGRALDQHCADGLDAAPTLESDLDSLPGELADVANHHQRKVVLAGELVRQQSSGASRLRCDASHRRAVQPVHDDDLPRGIDDSFALLRRVDYLRHDPIPRLGFIPRDVA